MPYAACARMASAAIIFRHSDIFHAAAMSPRFVSLFLTSLPLLIFFDATLLFFDAIWRAI